MLKQSPTGINQEMAACRKFKVIFVGNESEVIGHSCCPSILP